MEASYKTSDDTADDSSKQDALCRAEDLLSQVKSFKPIEVYKPVDLDIDVGNLMASDINIIDKKEFMSAPDRFMLDLARDNTQLLINSIWTLPTKRVEDAVVAVLPSGKIILPREKAIPKPKPPTKWEQYAREKGVKKHKKDKLIWDEELKKWTPRFGYRKVKSDKEKNWLVEVPDNAPNDADYLQKLSDQKKERIAKNELQRLRNIMRRKKSNVPSAGHINIDNSKSDQITNTVFNVRKATASVGKFTSLLPTEKKLRERGKKRKFDSIYMDQKLERNKSMKIVDSILNKKDILDVEKAVNKQISTEQKMPKKKSQPKNKGKKGSRKHFSNKKKAKPNK